MLLEVAEPMDNGEDRLIRVRVLDEDMNDIIPADVAIVEDSNGEEMICPILEVLEGEVEAPDEELHLAKRIIRLDKDGRRAEQDEHGNYIR